MTTTSKDEFSGDLPLTDGQLDRLNRRAFASRICEVLRGLPTGTAMVVGIHGPWGDGKTTVLNLLRADLIADDSIVVSDFNPWRLPDDEAMIRGFFSVLADSIDACLSTKVERVRDRAAKWAARLRWLTRPISSLWKAAETVDDLLARFGEAATKGDSVGLEELRNRIVSLLKTSMRRIVVLIDDIDRLDRAETHRLFRLIKACADFPNVCYVLAFDDIAVAKALGERYGGGDEVSGRAFLEKIIQVPLKLPVAAREDLRELCFEQVERALAAAGIELSRDQVGEFVSAFDRGASIRLTTPRAAKRFGNGLTFALPMLIGEANPVDLLLVESLRAFFPEIYQVVRDNHADFSGLEPASDGRGRARSALLLEPLMEAMRSDHSEAAKALVCDLFPRLGGIYNRVTYGTDYLERWSRERRISAPEYTARYFSYAVPRNDVPDSAIASIVEAAGRGDAASVARLLGAQLAGPKARRAIEKLRTIEATLGPEAAGTLAVEIAQQGTRIPNVPSLFRFAEPPAQAAILISHLLRQISTRTDRVGVAKRAIESADPLWFGVECCRWFRTTDTPEKERSNTLSKDDLQEVLEVLVTRIQERSATGAALFDPDVPQEKFQLFEWARLAGRAPVQAHLVKVFSKDPEQIGRFLESFAPQVWGSDDGLPHVGDFGADELNSLGFVIDPDTMADWVRQHCGGDFDNPEWSRNQDSPLAERLAEQFLFVHMKWKQDGEAHDGHDDGEAAS